MNELEMAEQQVRTQVGGIPPEELSKKRPSKIGQNELAQALKTLNEYKAGKTSLEDRIVEEEKFWRLQHWEGTTDSGQTPSSSAYMWNAVVNKHADMMDNYPEPAMLPREQSDEESAKLLSQIVPVVLKKNKFEKVYSDEAWYKIKHGTGSFGVFWNPTADNGLGDICISSLDVLNVFWQPGIRHIQESRNLFIVNLEDNQTLLEVYPQLNDEALGGQSFSVSVYEQEDTVDITDKSVVIDWYYKKRFPDGRIELHYCKFVGETVLYASEDEGKPFYAHGMYPIVLDVLYPESGTCFGTGVIASTKQPQLYVDALDDKIMTYLDKIANDRYWIRNSAGVNEDEFKDKTKTFVHCEGEINDEKLQKIAVERLDPAIYNVRMNKVEELKETAGNRDVNSGGATSGITSGAAIAVLQEAGNKQVRDIIQASYRVYIEVVELVIELMREFYDEARTFRVVANNQTEFVEFDNKNIKEQPVLDSEGNPITDSDGGELFRKPIFDIEVKAQKRNPYSRLSQNETAANLYNMGIFNPENAQMALIMLELMDFEGKEKVVEYVSEGATLHNIIQQQAQQIAQMQSMMGMMPQQAMPDMSNPQSGGRINGGELAKAMHNGESAALNDYGKNLVEKSKASAETGVEGGRFA